MAPRFQKNKTGLNSIIQTMNTVFHFHLRLLMIHKFLYGLISEEAGSNSINLGSLKFVFLAKWAIDLQNRKKHKASLL